MTSSRPRGSSRRFNLRLIALLLVAVAVFLGVIVAISTLTRSYTVLVATQVIPAGVPLTDGQFAPVSVNGDRPTLEGSSASYSLSEGDLDAFRGRLLTNTVYPGAIIQSGDFYIPAVFDPEAPSQEFATHFTQLLGKDQRALVITGDPTSTFVRVGDYVDVIWLPDYEKLNALAAPVIGPDGNPIPNPDAVTYTNSAQRLFTKRVIYAVPVPAPGTTEGTPADQTGGTVFVLDLTAQESQDLVWAENNGLLRITLTSPESVTGQGGSQVTTPGYFNNTYQTPVGTSIPATSATPEVTPEPSPSESAPSVEPSASTAP